MFLSKKVVLVGIKHDANRQPDIPESALLDLLVVKQSQGLVNQPPLVKDHHGENLGLDETMPILRWIIWNVNCLAPTHLKLKYQTPLVAYWPLRVAVCPWMKVSSSCSPISCAAALVDLFAAHLRPTADGHFGGCIAYADEQAVFPHCSNQEANTHSPTVVGSLLERGVAIVPVQ